MDNILMRKGRLLQQLSCLVAFSAILFCTSCPSLLQDVNLKEARRSGLDYSFVIWKIEMPEKIPAGEAITVPVKIINNGKRPWISNTEKPFSLSYHWKHPGGRFNSEMFWGERTPLPLFVGAGEMVTLDFIVKSPEMPKYYDFTIDVVRGSGQDRQAVSWFEELGWKTYNIRLEVIE